MSEISTLFDKKKNSKKPVFVKVSYTQEIYHGDDLKSRIELCKQTELTEYPGELIDMSKNSLPLILPVETKTNNRKGELGNLKIQEHNTSTFDNVMMKAKRNMSIWLLCFGITALLAVFFGILFSTSNTPLSINKIEIDLYENILDQTAPIKNITDSLKDLRSQFPGKILTCLVGPTGTGKTHVVNILGKQLEKNIQIFHKFNLKDLCNRQSSLSISLRMKLYFSDYFVIVLEDLKFNDIGMLRKFVDVTFEIEESRILILAVFNIETKGCLDNRTEVTDTNDIVRELNRTYRFYLSRFNYLNEDTMKRWLKKTSAKYDTDLQYQEDIFGRLLRSHDLRCYGLKGLHSKLLLELTEINKD